jgi:hypothetical protein
MLVVLLTAVIIFGLIVLFIVSKLAKKRPRNLNVKYFQDQWMDILSRVSRTPEGMIIAVIDADKLLDEALKKSHFSGKTMGERLVSAQRSLSDNDAIWYAHKLRNRLVHEPQVKIKKKEAQNALLGIKQGLKDLGAL